MDLLLDHRLDEAVVVVVLGARAVPLLALRGPVGLVADVRGRRPDPEAHGDVRYVAGVDG